MIVKNTTARQYNLKVLSDGSRLTLRIRPLLNKVDSKILKAFESCEQYKELLENGTLVLIKTAAEDVKDASLSKKKNPKPKKEKQEEK